MAVTTDSYNRRLQVNVTETLSVTEKLIENLTVTVNASKFMVVLVTTNSWKRQ